MATTPDALLHTVGALIGQRIFAIALGYEDINDHVHLQPEGFICPKCGGREHCVLARRCLYQCNACRRRTSLTAGTIFNSTRWR